MSCLLRGGNEDTLVNAAKYVALRDNSAPKILIS